jgi:hypothetical protein
MCGIEGASLQRGMNYRLHGNRSILLMSTRPNAPYKDKVLEDGRVLIYEGHDVPSHAGGPDPKSIDQPLLLPSGKPTQNGLFFDAAKTRGHTDDCERVWVYEKIKSGIWVFNGCFALRKAKIEKSDGRNVCRFRLELLSEERVSADQVRELAHTRVIPSVVKQSVWKRDGGKCVQCGSSENLHFDHIIPFSKGGTSHRAENIQILCAKHNLAKHAQLI